MAKHRAIPGAIAIVQTIVSRELRLSLRRTLVRSLFILSLASPLGFAGILMFRKVVEESMGQELDWDPIVTFLRVQCLPLALLALGLGAPAMIEDKKNRALSLYAARPLTPFRYALARIVAVALPVAALFILPGWGIIALRMGILEEATLSTSLLLALKVFLCALPIAWAYGGLTVAAGALCKKIRWALILTAAFFFVPDWLIQLSEIKLEQSIGPSGCATTILTESFETLDWLQAVWASLGLILYGFSGLAITLISYKKTAKP